MILIEESKPPRKLSGLSSLLISFPYNAELVNLVKTFEPAYYHKKDFKWEVPINQLTKVLDTLTFKDDITLKLVGSETIISKSEYLSDDEIKNFKYAPYTHQIEAINFGLNHNKWLNLSGMGLGKSLEAMYLAETLHRRGLIEHCLIICGVDSLRQNWRAEIQKFSKESVCVLGAQTNKNGKVKYATLPERAKQLRNKIDEFFIVVNITNVRDDNFVESFKQSENKIDMIVFDEAHRATKHSQQGQNLLKLNAEYKVAMTGTLIVNSPLSAYLPLAWTENDHATLTNFKSFYCTWGGFKNTQITGYKNLEVLNDEIASCSLRRTFEQVKSSMPKKTVEYELVEMQDKDRKFYDAIKNGVKEQANKIELNTNNLLALMTRLRQATSAPSVLTTEDISSSKLLRCAEIAEDIIATGEKVVILGNFKESVYTLNRLLADYKPLICTGDQSEVVVSNNITSFRTTDAKLIIGTMQKIGTGFSMPEAHYMLFVDQPYTAAMFDQACDRIYRITSEQPVYIKVLVDKDTVDERVREIVENKKDLADYMIDGKANTKFTRELYGIITEL